MTKTLSLNQARSRFSSLVDKADRLSERFIVTKNGTPKAVVLGIEEFESWVETLELFANPKAVKSLEQGLKEAKTGKFRSFKDLFGEEQRLTKALKPLKGLLKGDLRPWPYRKERRFFSILGAVTR
jgi:prevent-host-death family protein